MTVIIIIYLFYLTINFIIILNKIWIKYIRTKIIEMLILKYEEYYDVIKEFDLKIFDKILERTD